MRRLNNKELSEWYLLLSQQLDAGITLAEAIQLSGMLSSANRIDIVNALENGMNAEEVFERYASWMPKTDRALIAAANSSGKLPETLANLAVRRQSMHENISKATGATVYPIFVTHLAAIVTPIFNLLDFESGKGEVVFQFDQYIPGVLQALGIAWALIIIAAMLLRQNNPQVLKLFPILRKYSSLQAVSDLAGLLSSFIKAGATIDLAWAEAGKASRDSRIARFTKHIAQAARSGTPPSMLLNPKDKTLPAEFTSLYISGEQTGALDKNLDLLSRLFQEKANIKLSAASKAYPMAIFLAVAVYVGWGIANFYMQYLDLLMSIIK